MDEISLEIWGLSKNVKNKSTLFKTSFSLSAAVSFM